VRINVINGLGNANHGKVKAAPLHFFGDVLRSTEGAVPADAEQDVDLLFDKELSHYIRRLLTPP